MSKPPTHSERKTQPLWPDTAKALGIGKSLAYEAAARGEIPGCFRLGGRWLVAREVFENAMRNGVPFGESRPAA